MIGNRVNQEWCRYQYIYDISFPEHPNSTNPDPTSIFFPLISHLFFRCFYNKTIIPYLMRFKACPLIRRFLGIIIVISRPQILLGLFQEPLSLVGLWVAATKWWGNIEVVKVLGARGAVFALKELLVAVGEGWGKYKDNDYVGFRVSTMNKLSISLQTDKMCFLK